MFDSSSDSTLLNHFRASYPTGSIISELLHIHDDRYVVRVQIQTGGIILATGLSANSNIETAENQARARAIALLPGLAPAPTSLPAPKSSDSLVSSPPQPEKNPPPPPIQEVQEPISEPVPEPIPEPIPEAIAQPIPDPPLTAPTEVDSPILSINNSMEDIESDEPFLPEPSSELEEEFDFSGVSLKIEMELKRIQWSSKRETEYLNRMYGKKKRLVLNDPEMKEFLEYLQTYAQTTVELERLGWSNEQGSDYLKGKYPESKGSRMLLTCSQIKEFLAHLQEQNSSIHNYI